MATSSDKARTANTIGFVKQFLEFVIRQLVEFPDEMMLSEIPSGKMTIFRVQLRQSDVGRSHARPLRRRCDCRCRWSSGRSV